MLVIGKVPRIAVALTAAVALAGCTGGANQNQRLITALEMRGALLQAQDVGETWHPPDPAPHTDRLVSVCGGTSTPPPRPPGGEVVAVSLVDDGDKGAQTLDQVAIVYGDASAAKAGFAALRALADGCPPTVSVPRTITAEKSEPAYNERVSDEPLRQNGWSGFAVVRHKAYEVAHPGTADTAVAVLARSNVLLVDAYAVYRLGALPNASDDSAFTGDWQRLIGTVVNAVG